MISSQHRKYQESILEYLLDVIFQGKDSQIDLIAEKLEPNSSDLSYSALSDLAQEVDKSTNLIQLPVYVAVIGVLTDIKVKTLLTDLRSRYDIPNLAVSDNLTGSKSLERHLAALDFAQKVLNVEVIHGLNNLIDYLGGDSHIPNESEIVTSDPFSDYASFFQDKQNVLSYETRKLDDYVELTEKKSEDVYRKIGGANTFLMWWGMIFLTLTVVGIAASIIWPDRVDWRVTLVTGGLSLIQLLTLFFRRPMKDLLDNLTNLAMFRMILENHSLKTALARYHLTTPQTLREAIDLDAAGKQVKALEKQIKVLEMIEDSDYMALKDLGFGVDEADTKPSLDGGDKEENGTKEDTKTKKDEGDGENE
jgi:hypothetical protein